MKIKTLLSLAVALFAVVSISCDDNLSSLGGNIQPDGDDIMAGGDTVYVKAKTVSFKDSIYARTTRGMLGEYVDPVFGKIKSDYLCEFFYPKDTVKPFLDNVLSIDSVFLNTGFITFYGDSVSPMGVSVYEITSPLVPFFFTSIDPAKYCDMTKVLGQSIFTIQNVPDTIDSGYKTLKTRLDLSLGDRIYNEWLTKKETFESPEAFKEFFKGVYITTTFGSGSLIQTEFTEMDVHYTYTGRNSDDTADSIRSTLLRLSVTPEVIQMNRIKNDFSNMEDTDYNNEKTYMKTPAGLYTELTIPLGEILDKIGKDKTLNAVNFVMKGFTEEEDKLDTQRPNTILLINKDSLENFFYKRKLHDNVTSFIMSWNSSTSSGVYNSYDFGNIAAAVNHYADYYKNEAVIPDLKYLMIPISISTTTSSSTGSTQVTNIYNLMSPTSAILRTDPDNMKMSIVYSKYNNNRE
ncbi:hypothetical protein GGR21_000489 [Dysgonomonas hofstadii]|uniref:DUF4270 domain-containing protein n=1 Tax=Dysgonomonas hofstadii TaxID=637886 RepID=A0A840CPV2_9BACT|nr:DUF4270 domain-containing protein [Dysgonomonas hofstadii]MBB4034602.1 hypothetical protein [Dysgonomonas hofstadii]